MNPCHLLKVILTNIGILTEIVANFHGAFSQTTFNNVLSHSGGVSQAVIAFDNGFILAGARNNNATVIKVDSAGNFLWGKSIGGSNFEEFNAIAITNDSCYVLAGYTDSPELSNGGSDFFVVKINMQGDTLWSRAIGGSNYESAFSIQQTFDNGYIIGGYTYSFGQAMANIYTVKLDSSGNLQWTNVVGGNQDDIAFSVKQSPDSGYIITGQTLSFPPNYGDALIMRLTSSGGFDWANRYNISPATTCFGYDSETLMDGAVSYFTVGNSGIILLKTDLSGNIIWQKNLGIFNTGWWNNKNAMLHRTSDGSYVFFTSDYMVYSNVIVKVDLYGNVILSGMPFLAVHDIIEAKDGGYFIAGGGPLFGISMERGFDDNELGVIKTDSAFFSASCMDPYSVTISTDLVTQTPVVFSSTSGGNLNQIHPIVSAIVDSAVTSCVSFVSGIPEENTNSIFLFPNPFNVQTTIKFSDEINQGTLRLYNMYGEMTLEKNVTGKEIVINAKNLSSGVYVVEVREKGKKIYSGKAMVF